ncbi:MAG: dihydroneopterin aldolase [Alphaproteobacteria bacterium]|nr:dihydroneopterin aldolase [Alphaproteobacteria bacterium]
MDELFIEGLELQMDIGVLPEEHGVRQRVVVDVTAQVVRAREPLGDSIDDVLSYADIVELVEMLAAERRYNLVETFAERIARECLKSSRIRGVTIKVAKPDIMAQTRAVGVRISRN